MGKEILSAPYVTSLSLFLLHASTFSFRFVHIAFSFLFFSFSHKKVVCRFSPEKPQAEPTLHLTSCLSSGRVCVCVQQLQSVCFLSSIAIPHLIL